MRVTKGRSTQSGGGNLRTSLRPVSSAVRERFDPRGTILYISALGFLLALVSDRFWFDGFECFRVGDIKGLRPDPYRCFCGGGFAERRRTEAEETTGECCEYRRASTVGRPGFSVGDDPSGADQPACVLDRPRARCQPRTRVPAGHLPVNEVGRRANRVPAQRNHPPRELRRRIMRRRCTSSAATRTCLAWGNAASSRGV